MDKKDVIKTLELIATYLEIKGENPFKIAAYRKAALALEADRRTLEEIEDPSTIANIGKATSEVILELKETNRSMLLEELQQSLPEGLLALLKLPRLGGKKIGKLHRELNVMNLEDLRDACLKGRVQKVSGFGKKTEENILTSIEELQTKPERFPLAYVLPIANEIEKQLEEIPAIVKFSRAGSLRRMQETVKDFDYIIATDKISPVRNKLLQLKNVTNVISNGETKVSVELTYDYPINVDFRLVSEREFATTLHHFTGSKEHNIRMRQLAKERGEKINEYGVEKNGKVLTFTSEEQFFRHFDLHYIPPEAREDQGEIEWFQKEAAYIKTSDIKADLHMHTTWSDGANSIEEMAQAAKKRGYDYIAITDHSKFLKVANGLTEERLREQMKEIRKINERFDDFSILTGIEMDILPDGSLDFDDELLAEVDFVIASIHSAFSQDENTIMKRLTAAMNNPHVDLIAHPTGRLIGKRAGYQVNIEELIELAKQTDTALELNANPNRLDLAAKWLTKAEAAGVKLSINTDSHRRETFHYIDIGVGVARKGMIRTETVINTWPLEKLKKYLKRNS